MARLFDDASIQYLQIDQAPVVAAPMTVSVWFKLDGTTEVMFYLGDKDVSNHHWEMNTISGNLQWQATSGSGFRTAGLGGISQDVWQHGCAIEVSSTSRYAFLDGVKSPEGTGEAAPLNIDRLTLANNGQGLLPYNGCLAEVSIYDVVLTDDEVGELAAGGSPFSVRPLSLVNYWTIFGSVSPEIDLIREFDLTLFNAPVVCDHPPMMSPVPSQVITFGELVPPRHGASVYTLGGLISV